jgi:membrane associated rhomboid family serine protease
MVIPIHDDNPTTRPAAVTVLLIAACAAALLWYSGLDVGSQEWAALSLGVVPSVLVGAESVQPFVPGMPAELSLVTSMFLHAGWGHLIGNMAYLWLFGNNIEDRLGHRRFLVFYLLAGVASMAIHVALYPGSSVPVVGASGAVSGVLGAYVLLFPHARIRVIVLPLIFRSFRIPAWLFIGFWFVLQSFSLAADVAGPAHAGEVGGIAFGAHVGGFLAGMALLLLMRRRLPLFQRPGAATPTVAARGPWGRRPDAPADAAASRPPPPPADAPRPRSAGTPLIGRAGTRRPRRTVQR